MTRSPRRLAALVAVLLVPALAACAGGAPEPRHSLPAMYATEFDRLLKGKSINDFERKVLEDYQITDAEYAEAREAFRTCAADAGFIVTLADGGGFNIGMTDELIEAIPDGDGLSDDELNQMWSSDKSGLSADAVACLDEPRRK